MKKILNTVLLFTLVAVFTGCGTLAPDGPYKGDKVLYSADQIIVSSQRSLQRFVTWEMQNRAILPVEVSRAADSVRENAKQWIQSAINLREAYAANPNRDNENNLTKSLDILQTVLNEIAIHMMSARPPQPINN